MQLFALGVRFLHFKDNTSKKGSYPDESVESFF